VEVDRDKKAPKQQASGEVNRQNQKAQGTGNSKENPVGAGDKCQYSLLNFHRCNLYPVRERPESLQFACSFYNQRDVSESGNDSQYQKNQRKPGRGVKFTVQHHPDPQADKNRKGDGNAKAAEISQFLERSSIFSFHRRETLSPTEKVLSLIDLKVLNLTKD
jgi:hypothetical protein